MKPVRRRAIYLGTAVVTGLLLGFSCAAKTADLNPLRPADTSGPRATLQGFVETMDNIYLHMAEVLKSHAASGRHCLSPEERRNQLAILANGFKAARTLDTSQILPVPKRARLALWSAVQSSLRATAKRSRAAERSIGSRLLRRAGRASQ
jgi:MscS family membrane protein